MTAVPQPLTIADAKALVNLAHNKAIHPEFVIDGTHGDAARHIVLHTESMDAAKEICLRTQVRYVFVVYRLNDHGTEQEHGATPFLHSFVGPLLQTWTVILPTAGSSHAVEELTADKKLGGKLSVTLDYHDATMRAFESVACNGRRDKLQAEVEFLDSTPRLALTGANTGMLRPPTKFRFQINMHEGSARKGISEFVFTHDPFQHPDLVAALYREAVLEVASDIRTNYGSAKKKRKTRDHDDDDNED